jgi:hypothetical protein
MKVVHGYTELFAPVFMEIIISGIIIGLGKRICSKEPIANANKLQLHIAFYVVSFQHAEIHYYLSIA